MYSRQQQSGGYRDPTSLSVSQRGGGGGNLHVVSSGEYSSAASGFGQQQHQHQQPRYGGSNNASPPPQHHHYQQPIPQQNHHPHLPRPTHSLVQTTSSSMPQTPYSRASGGGIHQHNMSQYQQQQQHQAAAAATASQNYHARRNEEPSPLRYGPPYNTEFVDYSNNMAAGAVYGGGAEGGAEHLERERQHLVEQHQQLLQQRERMMMQQQQLHQQQHNGGHSIAVGGDSPLHNNNNNNNPDSRRGGGVGANATALQQHTSSGLNTTQNRTISFADDGGSRGAGGDQQPHRLNKPQGSALATSQQQQNNTVGGATDAQLRAADQARVRWAFSVDRTSRVQQPLMTAIASSNIRDDLVDVVRMLSAKTGETQTTGEASFIASTKGVNFVSQRRAGGGGGDDDDDDDEEDGEFTYDAEGNVVGRRGGGGGNRNGAMHSDNLRSIGVQSGLGLNRSNTATQVVEGDIASTAPTAQLDYDRVVALQQAQEDEKNGGGGYITDGGGGVPPGHLVHYEGGRQVVINPSSYTPFCSLPPEDYPVFLAEARRNGIANRYGFISLPRPPVELPPRRKVRAVQPTQYTHLQGRHELGLDEVSTSQLTRAYSLWIQGTGFVPKY